MREVKICAVVVTFNRKQLLMRTLTTLNCQSKKLDKIIIVDNASTDGTDILLEEHGFLTQDNLQYIRLDKNTGGAGGFYVGVKAGHEQGFDWLWLMDDDGYPDKECLANLLVYQDRFDFYGPLVIDDKKTGLISFPFFYYKKKIINIEMAKSITNKQIISGHISPFNGILVHKNLIDKIGYPTPEFFIWGDEINYWNRAKQANARIATITDILFYHPTAPSWGTPMFFGKMQFNDTDSMIKLYCLCRNNTYNLKKYHSPLHALLFFIKTTWFYTFTKPSVGKLKFCLLALWHGWQADFGHHATFIGKNFERK